MLLAVRPAWRAIFVLDRQLAHGPPGALEVAYLERSDLAPPDREPADSQPADRERPDRAGAGCDRAERERSHGGGADGACRPCLRMPADRVAHPCTLARRRAARALAFSDRASPANVSVLERCAWSVSIVCPPG